MLSKIINRQNLISVFAVILVMAIAMAPSVDAKKKKSKSKSTTTTSSANSVNGVHIADGSVANADLATNSITSEKITDGAVANADLGGDSVTADKIADGTIANADVSGSAAISGSKISPDFGSQNVTSTGTGTFGSVTSSSLNSSASTSPLVIGATYPGASSYVDLYPDTFAEGFLQVMGSLYLTRSSGSSTIANNATQPTETCNSAAYVGRIEIVDDTDGAGAWMWICEQTGASTYGWYRVQ